MPLLRRALLLLLVAATTTRATVSDTGDPLPSFHDATLGSRLLTPAQGAAAHDGVGVAGWNDEKATTTAGACVDSWEMEVYNDWLCSAGCADKAACRHGCAHSLRFEVPKGYYISRAVLTTVAHGQIETVMGYDDYEDAEWTSDLRGDVGPTGSGGNEVGTPTGGLGEGRPGQITNGWLEETENAQKTLHAQCAPLAKPLCNGHCSWNPAAGMASNCTWSGEKVESYVDGTLIPSPSCLPGHNVWRTCMYEVDVTSLLRSRASARHVDVAMHTGSRKLAGVPTAGPQVGHAGSYRFQARAMLRLQLAPEDRLAPWSGPLHGDRTVVCPAACVDSTALAAAVSGGDAIHCSFSGLISPATVSAKGVTCVAPDARISKRLDDHVWQDREIAEFTVIAAKNHSRTLSKPVGFYYIDSNAAAQGIDLNKWRTSTSFSTFN